MAAGLRPDPLRKLKHSTRPPIAADAVVVAAGNVPSESLSLAAVKGCHLPYRKERERKWTRKIGEGDT